MVPGEQLSGLSRFEVPEGDVTPSAAEKKQKLEEWANFPLRTREDLLAWRNGRTSRDTRYSTLMEGAYMERSGGNLNMSMETDADEREMEGVNQPMDRMGDVGIHVPRPLNHIREAEFENYLPPDDSGHSSTSTSKLPSTLPGSGLLGLSKEFQDTFLW